MLRIFLAHQIRTLDVFFGQKFLFHWLSDSVVHALCATFGVTGVVTTPCGSVVEHPLRDREVVGSNPSRTIPKALKMVPVATLLGAQHYKASTGFSTPNKYRTNNIATLTKIKKSEKCPIINNVCIHRRTVWKTGNHAKYFILLKYRDYNYYYNLVISQILYLIMMSSRYG